MATGRLAIMRAGPSIRRIPGDELSAAFRPPKAYTVCRRTVTAGSWSALGNWPIVRSANLRRGLSAADTEDGGDVVVEGGGCVVLGCGDEEPSQAAAAGIRHRQSRSVGKRMRAGG
jgi:hypothetical protein